MNKFEEVIVGSISAIKTETKNCQKACHERHENLNAEVSAMKTSIKDLDDKLFNPKDGIITNINIANARQGVITAISAFVGTTLAGLMIGYVFLKAVHGGN